MRRSVLLGMLVALAGCGAEERPAAPAASTSLVVTIDADGDGPAAPEKSRCAGGACAEVPERAFEPVSKRTPCTDLYGGPQTASVTGTLRGRPVSARFSRQNGCEISRWNLAKPLLER
jgi:hypothetical protein